ncbi:MAG: hypothetical protein RR053_02910 [Evtepia sp.]
MKHPLRNFMTLLSSLLLPLLLLWGVSSLNVKTSAEALTLAEHGLHRAAVQFYAIEGRYPFSLEELTTRYGAGFDASRFFVDYQYVAANLMPSITVLPLAKGAF